MLMIKDNVDLKELAKKYNMTYCQDWSIPYEDDNYGHIMSSDEGLSIFWRDDLPSTPRVKGEIIIRRRFYEDEEAQHILFDLIKSGLVEKYE